jgi:hypothetical protein
MLVKPLRALLLLVVMTLYSTKTTTMSQAVLRVPSWKVSVGTVASITLLLLGTTTHSKYYINSSSTIVCGNFRPILVHQT